MKIVPSFKLQGVSWLYIAGVSSCGWGWGVHSRGRFMYMSIYLQDGVIWCVVCMYKYTRFESWSLNKFSRGCCRMSMDISRLANSWCFCPPLLTYILFCAISYIVKIQWWFWLNPYLKWSEHFPNFSATEPSSSTPQSVPHGVRCAIDLCCLVQRLPVVITSTYPPEKWDIPWKIDFLEDDISFKNGPFSGDMLISGGVTSRDTSLPHKSFIYCQLSWYPALHATNKTLKKDHWTPNSTLPSKYIPTVNPKSIPPSSTGKISTPNQARAHILSARRLAASVGDGVTDKSPSLAKQFGTFSFRGWWAGSASDLWRQTSSASLPFVVFFSRLTFWQLWQGRANNWLTAK